jgi:hypothetical protein
MDCGVHEVIGNVVDSPMWQHIQQIFAPSRNAVESEVD